VLRGVIEGLSVEPEYLPEVMKMGIAWDAFIRNLHNAECDHQAEIRSLSLTPQQFAKISALIRAYQDLEFLPQIEGLLGCQYKIHVPISQNQMIGVIDRAYKDHIVESKQSSRPEFYQQPENIAYQVGTYFTVNPLP
jgi:hypothetical protein